MLFSFDINWDAVGAVGQWFGAIATFAAVLVAIHSARKVSVIRIKTKVHVTRRVDFDEFTINLQSTNVGIRDANISSMGFQLPNKKALVFYKELSRILPKQLKQSDSIDSFIRCSEFSKALKQEGFTGKVKLNAYCTDTYGNNHYSKRFVFDTTEWD